MDVDYVDHQLARWCFGACLKNTVDHVDFHGAQVKKLGCVQNVNVDYVDHQLSRWCFGACLENNVDNVDWHGAQVKKLGGVQNVDVDYVDSGYTEGV